uniref:Palmitoyltransferase n=1 Tax=Meloidogyne hapla TaxID=6305 RepID=A0A1I8BMR5_MELHA
MAKLTKFKLVLLNISGALYTALYWTAKSSSLLDGRGFEQRTGFALNGQFVANNKKGNVSLPIQNGKLPLFSNAEQLAPKSFTKYAICEDGTYVGLNSLREELHGVFSDQINNNNSPCKYCHQCKQVVPRRCHHCPLCGICVLRKDHHCLMLGGCAGLANQVSMVRWSLGWETAFNMGMAVLFSFSFASALGATGFFVFQMIYTLNGCTMYDYHRSGPKRIECDGKT